MNFDDALIRLEGGQQVRRDSWLPNAHILIMEDTVGKRTIVWASPVSEVVRWSPSSDDLLAHDWDVFTEVLTAV